MMVRISRLSEIIAILAINVFLVLDSGAGFWGIFPGAIIWGVHWVVFCGILYGTRTKKIVLSILMLSWTVVIIESMFDSVYTGVFFAIHLLAHLLAVIIAFPIRDATPPIYGEKIVAPISGTFQSIGVGVGDSVKEGQPVCIIVTNGERNLVHSGKSGVIGKVHVDGETQVHERNALFTLRHVNLIQLVRNSYRLVFFEN